MCLNYQFGQMQNHLSENYAIKTEINEATLNRIKRTIMVNGRFWNVKNLFMIFVPQIYIS